MSWHERWLMRRHIKILTAHMCADEAGRFHIAFDRHRSNVEGPEFIWLVLQYVARVLHVQGAQDPFSNVVLLTSLAGVAKKSQSDWWTGGIDAFAVADLNDVSGVLVQPPVQTKREIRATLYFIAENQRFLWTAFPRRMTTQRGVYSALALLQASYNHLDQEFREFLRVAIAAMVEEYETADPTRGDHHVQVPQLAYLRAALEHERAQRIRYAI